MTTDKTSCENGSFRKHQSFTMASNAAIRDNKLSLKAKGLYTLITSYITMPDFTLTKDFLKNHCTEKERAFNSAWDELKQRGFLKMHFTPSGQGCHWRVEYELLDVATIADGVHTYYYNSEGEVTETNVSRKERREAATTPVSQSSPHTPQNVGNGDRTLHYRTNGEHTYGQRSNGNVGYNIILPYKTKNNTLNKDSINQSDAKTVQASERDGLSEAEIKEQVIDELDDQQKVPYAYAADQRKMQAAIHYLTEWDFFQQHPYTTLRGFVDEPRMNAFNFCVECLVDMACAQEIRNYRGASISYAKVIDSINQNSNHCVVGGLLEFLEEAMDDFIKAYETTEIRDKRKYAMSVLWNCFSTYKVKQDAEYLG